MIRGNEFVDSVKSYFEFLRSEFCFELTQEKINGNFFYDVQYRDSIRIISISYENAEDFLRITVFILQKGELPDYDDSTKTLHLNKLNKIIFPKIDKYSIELNNQYFLKFHYGNKIEKKLLKFAKELRLCLEHFSEIHID